jgi:hypothetical protein
VRITAPRHGHDGAIGAGRKRADRVAGIVGAQHHYERAHGDCGAMAGDRTDRHSVEPAAVAAAGVH